MTRIILTLIVLLAMGGATVNAAPLVVKAGAKAEETAKPKKRRSFKSKIMKSVSFVAESAVNGGMSDR